MTRFSTGLLDAWFGEKVEIELPSPTGGVLKRTVTKKWWERMIAEGKISGVDRLEEQAAKLVPAASLHAVGMYEPLLERSPLTGEIAPDDWDFFATVAGVFIAATRLNNLRVTEEREARLLEIVARDLGDWNPNGLQAFEDCKSLFEKEYDRLSAAGHDPQFTAADALGIWLVWNLLGRQPQTDDEVMLVRSAGALITHAFFNWWAPQ